jgi:hypothetical protein
VIITVSKKWLIIGGSIAGVVVGVFSGLYLAGYITKKATEQIIKQIQTTLPPTTLSTLPTQPPKAPPPTTQQLTQTQNQQQQQQRLPPIQVGGFIPSPPPLPKTPPTTCTGTCPPGTIPMTPGIAHMAGCPVVTTICNIVCVPNYGPCLQKANQIEAQLSIYTSPQYIY